LNEIFNKKQFRNPPANLGAFSSEVNISLFQGHFHTSAYDFILKSEILTQKS